MLGPLHLQSFYCPPGKRLVIDLSEEVPVGTLVTYINLCDFEDAVEGALDIESSKGDSTWTSTSNLASIFKSRRVQTDIPYGAAGATYRYVYFQCPSGGAVGAFDVIVVSGLHIVEYTEEAG